MSLKSLAERLDVSERTLAYWAQRNMLPGAIKLGRSWKVRAADVDEWLKGKHQWQQSTNGRVVPISKPASQSVVFDEGYQLRKQTEEKLRKRQMQLRSRRTSA